MAKKKYPFDLKDIDKLGTQYSWVVSQRSTGKTYQVLLKGFEDYIKSNEVDQIGIIRRWDRDFSGSTGMRSCYNSLMKNGNNENMIEKLSKGRYNRVDYQSGKYYLGFYDEETGDTTWFRDKIIAYGFSLNLAERVKGGSFPNIHRILVDEACTTAGYLKNEFSAIQSIVSTIIRDRDDCKVYLMANNVDFYCPTFDDFGITEGLRDIKQGETKIFNYPNGMKVSFTWLNVNCQLDKPKASDIFFGFDNASSKMITQGDWEIPTYPHLPDDCEITPSCIEYIYFIQFKDKILQCEVCEVDGNIFTFIHKKTTPLKNPDEDLIFSDQHSHKMNIVYGLPKKWIHPGVMKVVALLQTANIFFDSNSSGYIFNTFITTVKE